MPVITSPEWSGSETGGRRYAPFTVNVERLKPWHTLTGRMHFFLDHDWMRDLGEALPIYRPPLDMHRLFGEPELGPDGAKQVVVRYLTPHSKWSIHSEYQDNLFMLSLSRGGPTVWMSPADAGSDRGRRTTTGWSVTTPTACWWAGRSCRHRMPTGVVFVHHAQERTIDVPKSETHRPPRRHPQLGHPAAGQTHPPDRRLRAAVLRVQLSRPHRQPARHGGHHPPTLAGGACDADARHGSDGHGDEPGQVHRVPHLLGHLQAGLDEPVRHRVRLVQQRGDPARAGLSRGSTRTRRSGRAAGCSTAAAG